MVSLAIVQHAFVTYAYTSATPNRCASAPELVEREEALARGLLVKEFVRLMGLIEGELVCKEPVDIDSSFSDIAGAVGLAETRERP